MRFSRYREFIIPTDANQIEQVWAIAYYALTSQKCELADTVSGRISIY